jgi:hypothetical protein
MLLRDPKISRVFLELHDDQQDAFECYSGSNAGLAGHGQALGLMTLDVLRPASPLHRPYLPPRAEARTWSLRHRVLSPSLPCLKDRGQSPSGPPMTFRAVIST